MQDIPRPARGAEQTGRSAEEAGGRSLMGEEEDLREGEWIQVLGVTSSRGV